MARLRVGVLVSGSGSNLQALIDGCASGDIPAEIVSVVSNIGGVRALDRAAEAGIPSHVVSHRDFTGREPFEQAIDEVLRADRAEFVCLAGFMRVLTPWFVERWLDRLLNIHPSLLPSFPGLHTHRRAIENGVKLHGCTVHMVRPALDDGPIVVQAAVPVLPDDDPERLAARVLTAEHRAYPLALKLVAEGRVRVEAGRAVIDDRGIGSTEMLLSPAR